MTDLKKINYKDFKDYWMVKYKLLPKLNTIIIRELENVAIEKM